MQNIRNIAYLLSFLFFISCGNNNYPEEILEHNLEKYYDIAKWRMYEANYRNEYVFYYDKKAKQNIVSCELIFKSLTIIEDTIVMRFSFFYPDSNMICYPGYNTFFNQIVFVENNDFPYVIADGFKPSPISINKQKQIEKDTAETFNTEIGVFYPHRIEEINFENYIKSTNNPLNKWLEEEIARRGILKE